MKKHNPIPQSKFQVYGFAAKMLKKGARIETFKSIGVNSMKEAWYCVGEYFFQTQSLVKLDGRLKYRNVIVLWGEWDGLLYLTIIQRTTKSFAYSGFCTKQIALFIDRVIEHLDEDGETIEMCWLIRKYHSQLSLPIGYEFVTTGKVQDGDLMYKDTSSYAYYSWGDYLYQTTGRTIENYRVGYVNQYGKTYKCRNNYNYTIARKTDQAKAD